MTDCLLIGFNDSSFENYVNMVKAMGEGSGAYRDLDLALVNFQGRPYRSMDVLNHYYFQHNGNEKPFHNADFLWPVITYLGSYLDKAGLTFDYVSFPHLEQAKLKEKLLREDLLTIAITTTLYVSPQPILETISFIRRYNRTAKIVVGGPFISNQPKMLDDESVKTLFKAIGADIYVTCQEGEAALVSIIRALKNGDELGQIDNLAFRVGDDYVTTKASIESNPLEENMVRYHLFSKEEVGEMVSLRTAKSCPFSCAFCGFPQRAGKYKYLSVAHVEQELDAIRSIGSVSTLSFIDDTFNVPKERFKDLLRMMIRNNYGFKWNSFYRSDHGDAETIELMSKAGCEGIFLGIESGSDFLLKEMNKTSRRRNYMETIPRLRDAGISTYASLIIGYPGETYETVGETISLIEAARPDFFRAQLWYCDPITPIWKKKDDYGIKGSAFNWSHATMDVNTACDLIDRIFLAISEDDSIWLPQFGFEFWSVFYLQRKGMSMGQIKTFLKCFNAVIKERLIYPNREQINPLLLTALETSCRFDQPDREPNLQPVELLSGETYLAAEQFWTDAFRDCLPASNIATLRDEYATTNEEWATLTCDIDPSLLSRLHETNADAVGEVILTAYAKLLASVNGRDEVVILASLDRSGTAAAVPLRLFVSPHSTFFDLVEATRHTIQHTLPHRRYALHLLTNPRRLQQHDLTCPVFDVAYNYRNGDMTFEPLTLGLQDLLDSYPAVRQETGLVLEVDHIASDIGINFRYRRDWFTPETVAQLNSYLASILSNAADNADAIPGSQGADIADSSGVLVENYAAEAFDF